MCIYHGVPRLSRRNEWTTGPNARAEEWTDGPKRATLVTGTPGRIIDFVESGKLDVSGVRFFVLDEADRLLDTGEDVHSHPTGQKPPSHSTMFQSTHHHVHIVYWYTTLTRRCFANHG